MEQGVAGGPIGTTDWLLSVTGRMLRSRSVESLLDLAYDAIRDGLAFDRVGIHIVDGSQDALVERVGTDDHGSKFYPSGRSYPLDGGAYQVRLLRDARLGLDGFGFILERDLPQEALQTLDGVPNEVLRVSLRTSESIVGLITVDNLTTGRPINAASISALVAFANTLAVALENVSLLEERASAIDSLDADVRRRAADLTWLQEIGRKVNAVETLDEVLDIVYDGIREGLRYDRVGIILLDRDRQLFEERRGTDEHGNRMRPVDRVLSLAEDSPLWGTPDLAAIMGGADFYYTDDAYAETPPEQRYLLDGEPKHNITVPLRLGERVTGIISVDNFVTGRPMGPEDAEPLVALANQVGTAVEKARLLEQERAERARLTLLLDTARALNSTLDNDEILRELASRLLTALDASVVYFSQVDRSRRSVRSLATHGSDRLVSTLADDERAAPEHFAYVEEVLNGRLPFYATTAQAITPAEDSQFLVRNGLRAELVVPLVVQGEPVGVLEVYWTHDGTITADAMELCVAIAEQAAVAMGNARLYAEVAMQAEMDPLTGLLNHRTLLELVDAALHRGAPFALLLVDVNDFKLFNDTHGHQVGDAVLIQIAGALREACREEDRAGRYGGDEFAVVLHGVSEEEAENVRSRLERTVRERPYELPDGSAIPLSISVGVSCFPRDGRSRQDLVAVADAGMYAAKRRREAETGGCRVERSGTLALDPPHLLGDTPFAVLEGLVSAVDARDRYTLEHSQRVARHALLLANALHLDDEHCTALRVAGLLHDLGKIAVPDRVLRKPGALTAEESELVERHVPYGVTLIRGVLEEDAVVEAVAHHHERWDGEGYPHAIRGSATPLLGRIMQIADAASAMMLDRPYRRAMMWTDVVGELRAQAGRQFDPDLVEPFIGAAMKEHEAALPAP